METVTIEKLVHGGQGLGTLPDGRKVFVWNALPGERLQIRIIKAKHSYAEAITENLLEPSPLRIEPRESNYLATSPWQILRLRDENDYKQRIVQELFTQAHLPLPDLKVAAAGSDWHYRNKMEYSFWGDDDGLHLALHRRGSHAKHIVTGSALAMPAVDEAAEAVRAVLQVTSVRASSLKTVVVRASQDGQAVASLFVKDQDFVDLPLPAGLQGLRIYFSNPRSPASVPTRLLYEHGDCHLHDKLLGRSLVYDGDSFFQINLPIFEQTLKAIQQQCAGKSVIDMYAGVGSIGLSIGASDATMIESDAASAAMARLNAAASDLEAKVIEAPAEAEPSTYITADKATSLIVDPPRAGLHQRLIAAITATRPPSVIYLSCNPATQARDIALLQPDYTIAHVSAYNFFPHTPHIETLAVLRHRSGTSHG